MSNLKLINDSCMEQESLINFKLLMINPPYDKSIFHE